MGLFPFTDQWGAAFAAAGDYASLTGHTSLAAEHLLVGLSRVPGGMAADLLSAVSLTNDQLQERIVDAVELCFGTIDDIARGAISVSVGLDHRYFGTDHLLIAVLRGSVIPSVGVIGELRAWLASNRETVLASFVNGISALALEDLASAKADLANVISRDGGRYRALAEFGLGRLHRIGGALDAAAAAFESSARYFEGSGRDDEGAQYVSAHCAFHSGVCVANRAEREARYRSALQRYLWLPGMDSYLTRCVAGLGGICEEQSDPARALDLYEVASAAQARDPWQVSSTAPSLDEWARAKSTLYEVIRKRFHDSSRGASFDDGEAHLTAAWRAFNTPEFDLAAAEGRRAILSYEAAKAPKHVADAQRITATALWKAGGDIEEAVALLRTAAATYERLRLDGPLARTHRVLGDVWQGMRRWNDARKHYRACHDAAMSIGDRQEAAASLLLAGKMYLVSEQFELAVKSLTAASTLVNIDGKPEVIALCDQLLAGALREAGAEFAVVSAAYRRAYRELIDLGQFSLAIDAFCGLGVAAQRASEYDDAASLAAEIVGDVLSSGESGTILKARQSVAALTEMEGLALSRRGEFEAAAVKHLDVARVTFEIGHREGAATALMAAGRAYLLARDHSRADRCFQQVADEFGDVVPAVEMAAMNVSHASALSSLDRKTRAVELIMGAVEVFEAHGARYRAANARYNLAAELGEGERMLSGDVEVDAARVRTQEAFDLIAVEDYSAAEVAANEAAQVLEGRDQRSDLVTAAIASAIAQQRQGRHGEAVATLARVAGLAISGEQLARVDVARADILATEGNHADAEQYYRSAYDAYHDIGDTPQMAYCARQLAELLQPQGRSAEGETYLKRAVALLRNRQGLRAELAATLWLLVRTWGYLHRYADVLTGTDELERVYLEIGDEKGVAHCARLRGGAHMEVGNLALAERLLGRAASLYEANGALGECAAAQRARAGILLTLGRHAQAIQVGLDGLANYTGDSRDDHRNRGAYYFLLGNAFRAAQNISVSRDYYEHARRELAPLGETLAVLSLDENLASLELEPGEDPAVAADRLGGLIPQARIGLTPRHLAGLLNNYATACRLAGRFAEAEAAFREARGLFFEAGQQVNVAFCDVGLALVTVAYRRATGDVLADVVPAAIFIDSQRHQFEHAEDRLHWKSQNEWVLNYAIRAASQSGDERAISDLVDYLINSGVHTSVADEGRSSADSGGTDERRDPNSVSKAANPPMELGGTATRLIAGAWLPMLPPPVMVRPSGRVVLAPHIGQADIRYGWIERPDQLVVE